MRFLIISDAPILKKENTFYSYAPYVNEMKLWIKYFDDIVILSPTKYKKELLVESFRGDLKVSSIPSISLISILDFLKNIFVLPFILFKLFVKMFRADHIHLRNPGSIGLLACFVQIFFPFKPKTSKYAGNWDPNSKQPLSYRLQKWILSNTFLTRNCKVLVYGEWPNQSKNIVPFFTASYSEKEIEDIDIRDVSVFKGQIATSSTPRNEDMEDNDDTKRQLQNENTKCPPEPVEGSSDLEFKFREKITTSLTPRNDGTEHHPQLDWGSHGLETNSKLKFIYVGGFTPGKQPLLSVQVLHELKRKGYQVQLDMYGDGVERSSLENYIGENKLHAEVILHGNTSKETVKEAYKKAHFLLFISKSEGWPKVVAEAMFWGCLPITSKVSCIPYMLDDGNRGAIVNANVTEIVLVIEDYLQNSDTYTEQVIKAMEWSRTYTLEKFEKELGRFLVAPLESK